MATNASRVQGWAGGRAIAIKSDVDAATGDRYVAALRRIGVAAHLEPMALAIDAELSMQVAGPSSGESAAPPPARSAYCSHCGKATAEADHFCLNCRAPVQEVEAVVAPPRSPLPNFGPPLVRGWGPFKAKHPFPESYDWLGKRVTFLFCKEHVVVINADESRNRALDVIESMGLVGGVVGAVRASIDSLSNKQFDLMPNAARAMFDACQLVWCERQAIEIWSYQRKPWLMLKGIDAEQLLCKFHTVSGLVKCFLVINSSEDITADYQRANQAVFQTSWSGIALDKLFRRVLIKTGVRDKDLIAAMEASRMSAPD